MYWYVDCNYIFEIFSLKTSFCFGVIYKIPQFISRMIADDAAEITSAPLLPEYLVSVKMETNDDVPSPGKHYYSSKKFNLKYPVRSLCVEFSLPKSRSYDFF